MFEIRTDDVEMLIRLLAALAAGAFIGYERSFHGRPAGLRTHVLVCLASAVLMLVTVYEDHWVRTPGESRLDPTRMAQGIMTGIGFLGAGVIVKEGLNVRGLTTAASIWITAAIGVLAGVGLYLPMVFAVIMTLSVLSVFRWIEMKVPTQAFYYFDVKYEREGNLSEEAMRELLKKLGFSVANFSYRLEGSGTDRMLRHKMTLQTTDRAAAARLARWLEENRTVLEFRLLADRRLIANTLHNPPDLFPRYANYSHAVEVRGGARLLFIRGLNGYLADGMTVLELEAVAAG